MRVLLALTMLAAAPQPADAPKQAALAPAAKHGGATKCGACHVTASWSAVRFNHDKTGFPLRGGHARVDCKSCHAAEFTTPIARQCGSCHFDAHQGDLGSRCGSCHDETTWRTLFDADAHRRTAFPLLGAHGALPCQECHSDSRDRRLARATVPCASCHAADLMRTAGTGVDHGVRGFTQPCEQCHGALSFKPARFPGHDTCFRISAGPHALYTCEQCHDALPFTAGSCETGTAKCTSCHEHACGAKLDGQHPASDPRTAGYSCTNVVKCAQCHQFD